MTGAATDLDKLDHRALEDEHVAHNYHPLPIVVGSAGRRLLSRG